jgi:ubiquinol-cytochrome c reductase cytochrome c subunit
VTTVNPRRRHPLAAFALILVALMVTGFAYTAVSGASGDTATAAAAAHAASQTQIDEGKQLYLEGCSSCHGLGAEGLGDYPTLIGVGAAAVDFQVSTGRMPLARPEAQAPRKGVQYTDEEIAALAAYVASLSPGPAIPTAEDLDLSDADLAIGGELYRTNCAQCHSVSGKGGALTQGKYAPTLEGVSAKDIWQAMVTGPSNMPVFGNETLRPDDKRDIIKYIETITTQPDPGGANLGRLGPVTEGVFIWVVGLGALIGVSVWIGVKAA